MQEELYELFRRNFPYVTRGEKTVRKLLDDPGNTIFEKRNGKGKLIGASVANGSTVYLLCVDREYRNRGLGSTLLRETEDHLRRNGKERITIGVGEGYLTPGVPVGVQPFREELGPEALCPELINKDAAFFEKRGYVHSWGEANCFDMAAELSSLELAGCKEGDTVDGVTYRWAGPGDVPGVLRCVEDGEPEFAEYYRTASLYEGGKERVLLASLGEEICGAVQVCAEGEGPGTGSLGCTVVANQYRNKGIATRLIFAGTAYLKETGLRRSFIGYTYSGLQRLYGRAGYRICTYYFMAEKKLNRDTD